MPNQGIEPRSPTYKVGVLTDVLIGRVYYLSKQKGGGESIVIIICTRLELVFSLRKGDVLTFVLANQEALSAYGYNKGCLQNRRFCLDEFV